MKYKGTCIVGIEDGDTVWIGADTLCSNEEHKFNIGQCKIVRLGDEMLLGAAGSVRVHNILHNEVQPPPRAESEQSDLRYIVNQLVPEMRDKLAKGGTLRQEDGVEEVDANVLIGYRGGLYVLWENLAVARPTLGFHAIGSGSLYALGSLHSTRTVRDPRKRLRMALEAASEFCPSVGGEPVIEYVKA